MELTARQLRTGIRSPQALARQQLMARIAPIPPDTPRSAQRPWMRAAIRTYYASGRKVTALLDEYDKRTNRSKRRESAATEIANGRRMLELFAVIDREQPDPARVQTNPARVEIFGHGLTIDVDMVYETLRGAVLVQVVTDDEIRRREHLQLYATALALHYEGRPDGGRVARVELWMLRSARGIVAFDSPALRSSIPSLRIRLDEIARGAPGRTA